MPVEFQHLHNDFQVFVSVDLALTKKNLRVELVEFYDSLAKDSYRTEFLVWISLPGIKPGQKECPKLLFNSLEVTKILENLGYSDIPLIANC